MTVIYHQFINRRAEVRKIHAKTHKRSKQFFLRILLIIFFWHSQILVASSIESLSFSLKPDTSYRYICKYTCVSIYTYFYKTYVSKVRLDRDRSECSICPKNHHTFRNVPYIFQRDAFRQERKDELDRFSRKPTQNKSRRKGDGSY